MEECNQYAGRLLGKSWPEARDMTKRELTAWLWWQFKNNVPEVCISDHRHHMKSLPSLCSLKFVDSFIKSRNEKKRRQCNKSRKVYFKKFTHFPYEFVLISHTSLALMFIYRRGWQITFPCILSYLNTMKNISNKRVDLSDTQLLHHAQIVCMKSCLWEIW